VNWEVFITCAVTGAGATTERSDRVPVTPGQIADAAIEAARAGAAVAHIHVRDPGTGRGARDVELYREVVERVRASDVDVVLNLTAGMGGDLVLGGADAPLPLDAAGTDMAGAEERLAHVEALRPEICTLDLGSMNFAAGGDYVMVNTPEMLRAMARRVQELGVRPEPCSPPSPSAGCSCRSSRWLRSSAATCVSGSRTTCSWPGASQPPTASSWSARSPSSRP
jgi:uncharacterized protein (DUF849 family)